jgi:hypothetical protein
MQLREEWLTGRDENNASTIRQQTPAEDRLTLGDWA